MIAFILNWGTKLQRNLGEPTLMKNSSSLLDAARIRRCHDCRDDSDWKCVDFELLSGPHTSVAKPFC